MAATKDRTAQGQARAGNRLAMQSGVYSCLAIGSLPKGARQIRFRLGQYRKLLAERFRQFSGRDTDAMTPREAGLLLSAVEQERVRRLSGWYLAKNGETLNAEQWERFLLVSSRATDARDRCVAELFSTSTPPPTGQDDRAVNELGLTRQTMQKLRQAMYDATPGDDLRDK